MQPACAGRGRGWGAEVRGQMRERTVERDDSHQLADLPLLVEAEEILICQGGRVGVRAGVRAGVRVGG